MQTKPLIKTPISYYGGKQAIIHHILPLIPDHDIYTETFFGGGTVFFAKRPVDNETINDRLDIVINFYRVLKTRYKALKKLIDLSLVSRTMHQQATLIAKGKIPADNVTKAWAFWYASNFSFMCKIGGSLKHANDGDALIWMNLKNKKESFTEELVNRIEKTHIENNHWLQVIKTRNVANAFHHLDTPYFNSDCGHYRGWKETDLSLLLQWCANECKGKFLLSNFNSPVLDQFVQAHGWRKKEITTRLKAQRKTGSEKIEVLVWNYQEPIERNLFNQ